MEISQKLLCFLFLSSFAAGAALGVIYDLFYLSRLLLGFPQSTSEAPPSEGKRAKVTKAFGACLLFMEDFLFILLAGVSLLLLLYFVNDGQFRMGAPLGLGCGFFAYRVTLGRCFLAISSTLVKLVRRVVKLLLGCLLFPLRIVGRCLDQWILAPMGRVIAERRYRRQVKATQKAVSAFVADAETAFRMNTEEIR